MGLRVGTPGIDSAGEILVTGPASGSRASALGLSYESVAGEAIVWGFGPDAETQGVAKLLAAESDGGRPEGVTVTGPATIVSNALRVNGRIGQNTSPTNANTGNYWISSFTTAGTSTAHMNLWEGLLSVPSAGSVAIGHRVETAIEFTAGAGTIAYATNGYFGGPSITPGSGRTVSIGSAVRIAGPSSGAVQNYALYVASGETYLGGNLTLPSSYIEAAGNPSLPVIATNNVARFSGNTGQGAFIYGKGSTYDVALANANTVTALAVPTGGNYVVLPGGRLGFTGVSPTLGLGEIARRADVGLGLRAISGTLYDFYIGSVGGQDALAIPTGTADILIPNGNIAANTVGAGRFLNFNDAGFAEAYFGINNASGTLAGGIGGAYGTFIASYNTRPIHFGINGVSRVRVEQDGAVTRVVQSGGDNGTSYGSHLSLNRNSSDSTPAAGFLQLFTLGNVAQHIWPDNTGALRIGNPVPTFANDGSGAVVGTQTSWHLLKDITRKLDAEDDARLHAELLAMPRWAYRMRNDSMRLDKEMYGPAIYRRDQQQWWSMNDAENQIPTLDQLAVNDRLFGSVAHLTRELNALKEAISA